MSKLIEFWSDIKNVENATSENIQSDILAYLNRITELENNNQKQNGLYSKYTVINNETGEKVNDGFFVLKPNKDRSARIALLAYADATDDEQLASDLRKWATPSTPLGTYLDYDR